LLVLLQLYEFSEDNKHTLLPEYLKQRRGDRNVEEPLLKSIANLTSIFG
jgi:hypothetical protein